ncbi:acyl-CoA thioester hydrolase/BAAT C-terminal domain-containing protein [Nonomuraea typhae]|uniref:acyl-CoA thioester hydrolase/BAAT C-terminal domain-containing protein n=1 Tax=Nonomuraea typhae TaxID=2603600 RepID=UPI0012FC7E35|nr:acyl-CoA thioester hydrolase/BAAT C-terminal domain-containing protein [Nonomuraea typhae]
MESHLAVGGETGVLVLAGSSGRIDAARCDLLAAHGLTALSPRWFGGPGQSPGICEIPLETFVTCLDRLTAAGAKRLTVLGLSKGAEAALALACVEPRVRAVVALSPSSVVWPNVGPGRDGVTEPYRSSWTWRGRPLPFAPYPADWPDHGPPTAFRDFYARGLAAAPAAAAIPLERSRADVLLVAGEDDQMWPSAAFARALAARRPVRLITHPSAGHRPVLPGETPAAPSPSYLYGGAPEADAELGATAWPEILDVLM